MSAREQKRPIRADSLGSESKSMHSNMDQNIIVQLKEQLDSLLDEKNALLDYIEENMDKN
jgi:RNA processing factor Prp31